MSGLRSHWRPSNRAGQLRSASQRTIAFAQIRAYAAPDYWSSARPRCICNSSILRVPSRAPHPASSAFGAQADAIVRVAKIDVEPGERLVAVTTWDAVADGRFLAIAQAPVGTCALRRTGAQPGGGYPGGARGGGYERPTATPTAATVPTFAVSAICLTRWQQNSSASGSSAVSSSM